MSVRSSLARTSAVLVLALASLALLDRASSARAQDTGGEGRELIESGAPPRASLRIRSPLPGVELLLDERPIGVTPLNESVPLPIGPHRLLARRRGYLTLEHRFEAEAGAEVSVDVALVPDPSAPEGTRGRIVLQLPEAEWRGTIDGAPIARGETELELPVGPHELSLEVARRRPVRLRVDVPIASTTTVRPELEWTPDARAEGHAALDTQHTIGVTIVIAGGVLVAAALATFVINRDEWEHLDRIGAVCADEMSPACRGYWEGRYPSFEAFEDQWDHDRRVHSGIDIGAVIGVGVGAALLVSGTILLIATPSHSELERSASARVELGMGPGSLRLRGAF